MTYIYLYSNVLNACTNAIYLGQLDRNIVIHIMLSMRVLKNAVITGGYDSEFIRKGIKEVDLEVIRLNDESPEAVISRLERSV